MDNSNHKTKIFDLKGTSLTGSNLLEAGAGTGKTYSLAYLYLRLLLEKGLLIEEILVATFTVAATAELKGRIFETIQNAERAFGALVNATELPNDAFLLSMLSDIRSRINDDQLLQQRFRLALAQFDYAQILTINGFALQLLRENTDVLDSYTPEVILNDDSEFVKKAYLELARDNFSPLGDNATAVGKAVSGYSSEGLFALLAKMLEYRDYIEKSKTSIFNEAKNLSQLIERAFTHEYDSALAIIANAIDTKQLNGKSYPLKKLETYASLLSDADAYYKKDLVTFFSRKNLQDKCNKKATETFDHDFFHLFDEILEKVDSLDLIKNIETFRALLLLIDVLAKRVSELKAEQMALTHSDIVHCVAKSATNINSPLKAALIDEAQDTNAQQMDLFRALFLSSSDDKTVFFVGDPKQAIYGFRGANIYSYLEIEKDVTHHYIMDTNYRSTKSLNASVNTFFSGQKPFITDKITYHEINWDKKNNESPWGDKSLTFVTAEAKEKTVKVDDLADAAAKTLLSFINEKNAKPRDIAVLVSTGSQAKKVKTSLATYGLSASYTGRFSVYETDEAKLMLALLNAIHSGNSRLTKSLMLTPLFGYALAEVADNEVVIELNTRLHRYADDYVKRGFGTMFYRVMNYFMIAGRLLQSEDGKRRLTNFIQLFELLQKVLQKQSLSLAGLCDNLSKLTHEADKEAELRLEDDQAITIMTIHSAKGLEFPVVCLPFFEHDRTNNRTDGLLVSHENGLAAPAFLKPKSLLDIVKAEESAENRRLAYVALTRAKYHNIIIRKPTPSKTAMLTVLLETLGDNQHDFLSGDFVAEGPKKTPDAMPDLSPTALTYQAKKLTKSLYSDWQLESFSRLQQQVAERYPQSKKIASVQDNEEIITGALMDYPSGARAGSALHEMYEHFMQYRHNDEAFHEAIDKAIDKHLFTEDKSSSQETSALADAITETTSIPLIPNHFSMRDIKTTQQSIEMKFFMHLSPKARQNLLQTFEIATHEQHLIPTNCYVHGYIDYCFEHDGRFYVLDYKSNRLGETYHAYDRAGMHTEMQHHRYDLQALIYTLALCKHLSIGSEDEYHTKIGGYYYLFVRGMAVGENTGIYQDKITWEKVSPFLATTRTANIKT